MGNVERTASGTAEYIIKESAISIFRAKEEMASCTQAQIYFGHAAKMLELLPAADVSPVRHGRWIDKGEYAVCMECGGRSGTQYDGVEPIPLMTQFCPNCGAKMDGGDD